MSLLTLYLFEEILNYKSQKLKNLITHNIMSRTYAIIIVIVSTQHRISSEQTWVKKCTCTVLLSTGENLNYNSITTLSICTHDELDLLTPPFYRACVHSH